MNNQLLPVAGVASVTYKDVFIIESLFCKTCNQIFLADNGLTVCVSNDDLIKTAELRHGTTNTENCIKPSLLITYKQAKIDSSLYQELLQATTQNNESNTITH